MPMMLASGSARTGRSTETPPRCTTASTPSSSWHRPRVFEPARAALPRRRAAGAEVGDVATGAACAQYGFRRGAARGPGRRRRRSAAGGRSAAGSASRSDRTDIGESRLDSVDRFVVHCVSAMYVICCHTTAQWSTRLSAPVNTSTQGLTRSPCTLPAAAPHRAAPPAHLALGLVDELAERIRDGQHARRATSCPPRRRSCRSSASAAPWCARRCRSCRPAGWSRRTTASAPSCCSTGETASFRIAPEQIATSLDVMAVLELRISLETEAAGLAATRRTEEQPGARCARRSTISSAAIERGRRRASRPTSASTWRSRRPRSNPHFARHHEPPRHDDHSARAAQHRDRAATTAREYLQPRQPRARGHLRRHRATTIPNRRARRCAPT